jgi:ferric-dicitrate binding protein FerR (iron transport regulator)
VNPSWPILIQQYIANDISDDNARALELQLKENAALRDLYLDAVHLDAALAATAEAAAMAHTLATPPSPTTVQPAPAIRHRARLAIAAIAALFTLLLTLWHQHTHAGVEFEVLRLSDHSNSPWKPGSRLRKTNLLWTQGSLEIRLSSGVTLTINGSAQLHLVSPMEVRLRAGRITADVGERGKGFLIETNDYRIVDLGTVFGVDASPSAKTDVVVFNGQVEVHEKGSSQPSLLLSQGEGVRLERNRRTSRIVSVNGPDDPRAWSAKTHPPENTLITAVSDSMSADEAGAAKWPSLRNFYRIVPNGLRNGALAFADTLDEWSDVPPELIGADQVRTFAVDRYNWWMRITLEIAQPVELFVLVDRRNPVPAWVRESFAPTGHSMTLDFKPEQARGAIVRRFPYDVWSRRVESPGTITLGAPYENPPADRKSFSPNNMFGIAARPLR